MAPLTHTWCTCVGHCRGPFTKWATVLPHSVPSSSEEEEKEEEEEEDNDVEVASVEGTKVCLEIPLQSPPPSRRPSRANRRYCKGGGGYHVAQMAMAKAAQGMTNTLPRRFSDWQIATLLR